MKFHTWFIIEFEKIEEPPRSPVGEEWISCGIYFYLAKWRCFWDKAGELFYREDKFYPFKVCKEKLYNFRSSNSQKKELEKKKATINSTGSASTWKAWVEREKMNIQTSISKQFEERGKLIFIPDF